MKEERLLFLVKTRLDQSLETLEDARALLSAGRSPPSILNRSYYGVFYAALALLQTIGETPSKHSGVLSLFDIEFYKRGLSTKEMSKVLHELFELRQVSDYRLIEPISREQAHDALAKAESFVSAVQIRSPHRCCVGWSPE